MEIDALGTYNMSHSVYPAMSKNSGGRGGVIINISMTLHYGATWYQVSTISSTSRYEPDHLSISL